jgi:4-hydroxybenzoate polyprenyltransferase
LEILLMPGFVMASLPFVGPVPGTLLLSRGAFLFLGSLLLVLAVYAVNSYFGFETDQLNPRLTRGLLQARKQYAPIAVIALLLSFLVFARLDARLPALAFGSFVLWCAYSLPRGAKSRPVWGTMVHFSSQILQFHLGIVAFGPATTATFLVSVFFAAMFSCGHLMHELKDYDSDRAAGIRTNAVVFGPSRVIRFYKALVVVVALYWAVLYACRMITLAQFLPLFLASVTHAALALTLKENALRKNESFQGAYRALYLGAGLVTLVATRF